MTRRELIQKTTLALGYTLSAPTMLGILSGCQLKHELSYKPVFFTDEQGIIIGDLSEIILPGAKNVGVPAFIDNFIKEVYSREEKEKFIQEMKVFNEGPLESIFRLFTECTPDSQLLYTELVHHDALASVGSISEGWWNNSKAERPFILKVKELTILGFFTSQVGATQVLQYNAAPGPYQGCVPLSQVGKAWAT